MNPESGDPQLCCDFHITSCKMSIKCAAYFWAKACCGTANVEGKVRKNSSYVRFNCYNLAEKGKVSTENKLNNYKILRMEDLKKCVMLGFFNVDIKRAKQKRDICFFIWYWQQGNYRSRALICVLEMEILLSALCYQWIESSFSEGNLKNLRF